MHARKSLVIVIPLLVALVVVLVRPRRDQAPAGQWRNASGQTLTLERLVVESPYPHWRIQENGVVLYEATYADPERGPDHRTLRDQAGEWSLEFVGNELHDARTGEIYEWLSRSQPRVKTE
jgi:hypothetical protein